MRRYSKEWFWWYLWRGTAWATAFFVAAWALSIEPSMRVFLLCMLMSTADRLVYGKENEPPRP